MSTPQDLQRAIETDSLVIFAGAGCSIPLKLPTWKQLVLEVLGELKKDNETYGHYEELINANLISILTVLTQLERRHKPIVTNVIAKRLVLKPRQDFPLQKKILELSSKIITSNYDNAFEYASDSPNIVNNDGKYKLAKISDLDQFIFKIHGDISDPDQCTVFESQYQKLYKDSAFTLGLKILFIQKTVLFIGFSLTDPYINHIIEFIRETFSNFGRRHYILTTDKTFDEDKFNDIISTILIDDYDQSLISKLDEFLKFKRPVEPIERHKTSLNLKKRSYNTLIGRKKEIEDVMEYISMPRSVTSIEGLPGVGKTSLALEIAYICLGQSDISTNHKLKFDFVIWISMNDYNAEGNVLNRVFDEIGRTTGHVKITQISNDDFEKKSEAVRELLQANKVLIIIDNYEANDDESLEEWIQSIDPPTEVLLTTLRRPNFEHNNYSLKELSEDDAFEFVQREANRQNLQLGRFGTRENLKKLYNITGGIPQALILTLGLMRQGALRIVELSEASDQFDSIYDRLYTNAWDELSYDAKSVLSLIPLFISQYSIDRNALLKISRLNIKDFNFVTKELCDWNLLTYNISNEHYNVHPTLIGFLKSKTITPFEPQKVRPLFIDYYLELVQKTILRTSPDEIYWNSLVSDNMKHIEGDWPSILQAINWCVDHPVNAKALLGFVISLVHFMDSRFYNQERLKFVKEAIKACHKDNNKYLEALLKIDALGWTLVEENEFLAATKHIVEGYKIVRRFVTQKDKSDDLIALASAWLARAKIEQSDSKQANKLIEKALSYANKKSSKAWIKSRIFMAKGDIDFKLKDYNRALFYYKKAKLEIRDYGGEGYDYQINPRLGLAFLSNRNLVEAEEMFAAVRDNHEIFIGSLYGEYGLAMVMYERGMHEVADEKMKNVEEEILKRSNSNLLLKLIFEYKVQRNYIST